MSREEQAFVSHVVELMGTSGRVHARKMFGGYGLYLDGLMFALIAGNVLYLKGDELTAAEFRQKGLQPFTYQRQGRAYQMSYFEAPPEALEESDEMARWVEKAHGAALRAAAKRR